MIILPVQTVSMTKMYPTILFNNILQFDDKPVRNRWTMFVCKKLYGERKAILHYIYLLCMFWYYKENLACVLWRDRIINIERRIIMCNFFFSHVFYYYLVFIIYLSAVLYRFPHVDVNSFHIKSTWNVTGNLTTCIASNGSQSLVVDTVGLKPGTFQFGTNA